MDAVRYVADNGVKWANLPCDFPPYRRVHAFARRWQVMGLLAELHDRLRDTFRSPSVGPGRSAGALACPFPITVGRSPVMGRHAWGKTASALILAVTVAAVSGCSSSDDAGDPKPGGTAVEKATAPSVKEATTTFQAAVTKFDTDGGCLEEEPGTCWDQMKALMKPARLPGPADHRLDRAAGLAAPPGPDGGRRPHRHRQTLARRPHLLRQRRRPGRPTPTASSRSPWLWPGSRSAP
ncbi:hypothetical protein GCM10009601_17400 [Streptomyces thermospinosisporus]|uniref:Insertion element IS402-like domain-containing protein n=1 Tax=Streptomyces thermospinosisporus TaxID=161482 RepID=A0ABN1YS36_9ACTN